VDLLEQLRASRIVPVVRVGAADEALDLARTCAQAGLRTIEFTATTKGWTEAVRAARAEWPDLVVGAGTMRTQDDAEQAAEAGAQFLVSPMPAPAVRGSAERLGLPFVEGGFTPAELGAATAYGPAKLFPAHVGGPAYLRSLLAVLPGAAIMPTGGIQTTEVAQWLAAGAIAVGVGSDLTAPGDVAARVRDALAGTDPA
jgi:2-dehydro-3-deoxyphosphogluconate aldolase / (4S)-4-hydroxy-2-oxoglutarate aldolase